MVICKILNNNVIVTSDQQGAEIVAMGRGLAFGRRVGQEVDETKVEKIYRLASAGAQARLAELLAGIDPAYLRAATEIIEQAEQEIGPLADSIYVSLTDHLHSAALRQEEGVYVPNKLLWELRRFYPQEYALGQKGVELLRQKFGIELAQDEAGFIAMHIITAAGAGETRASDAMGLVEALAALVRRALGLAPDPDSLAYFRFITHLKFFARRVLAGEQAKEELDGEMAAMVKQKYARAYQVAEQIAAFVWEKHGYLVTRDEKFYLSVHIERLRREG